MSVETGEVNRLSGTTTAGSEPHTTPYSLHSTQRGLTWWWMVWKHGKSTDMQHLLLDPNAHTPLALSPSPLPVSIPPQPPMPPLTD